MLCLCAQIFMFPSVTITTSYIRLVSMCFETHYRIICWVELKKQFLGAFLEFQLCVLPLNGLALSALWDIQIQQSRGVSVCGSNSKNHFHIPRSHAVLNHSFFCWRLEILCFVRHIFPGALFLGVWHCLNFIYSALKIFIKQKLEDNWVWSNNQTFIIHLDNAEFLLTLLTVAKMQLEILYPSWMKLTALRCVGVWPLCIAHRISQDPKLSNVAFRSLAD